MTVQEMARELSEQHNALASQGIRREHGMQMLLKVYERMAADHSLAIEDALSAELEAGNA
jgi:hypothetical protein